MNTEPIPEDIRTWIEAQPDGQELAGVWRIAGKAMPAPADGAAIDEGWLRLEPRLKSADVVPRTGAAIQRGRHGGRLRDRPARPLDRKVPLAAAILATVVAVAAVVIVMSRSVIIHAEGEVVAVSLPDGSQATLAAGSNLRYKRWSSDRAVQLEGQAHFRVEPGQPFSVRTFNAEVRVLGTAFDVRAWPLFGKPEYAETDVIVYEGRVALRPRVEGEEEVELERGQRSRVVGERQLVRPRPADLDISSAWRSAGFAAYDMPLAGIVAQIEARFSTRVILGPTVDPARRVTALLPETDSAEAVLTDVAAYLGYSLERRADGTFELY